jgi:catechol 2,3-dioxygenase-like lactoylglutathione lyase family enzyme
MIVGGRHMGIPVSDMARARTFYEKFLGFVPKVDEVEEGPFISTILGIPGVRVHVVKLLAPDGWMLELLEYIDMKESPRVGPRVNDVGCAHLALTVQSLDSFCERLTAAGVRFISPPQTAPRGNARVAFCQDWEGNFVELVQPL